MLRINTADTMKIHQPNTPFARRWWK